MTPYPYKVEQRAEDSMSVIRYLKCDQSDEDMSDCDFTNWEDSAFGITIGEKCPNCNGSLIHLMWGQA